MNNLSGHDCGKSQLVLVALALLFGGGVLVRAEPAATLPAGGGCHETTLWLPKVSAPFGDPEYHGAIALRNAMSAHWRGDISTQRSEAAEAAAFFALAGKKGREGAALQVMAAADEAMAHYDDASCEFEEAGSIADSVQDAPASAAAHSSLGAIETLTREYDDAGYDLKIAMERARQANDVRAQAGVFNNLGNLHAAMAGAARSRPKYSDEDDARDKAEGDADQAQALDELDRAIAMADQAKESPLAAKAAANAALAAARDGQLNDAARRTGDALTRVSNLPDSHEKAFLLTTVGQTGGRIIEQGHGDAGLLKQAAEAFGRAIRCAQGIGDAVAESYATGMYGHLYESHGTEADAMELSRRASFLAQKAQSPDSLYLWQWQTARLLTKQKNGRDDAIDAYMHAADNLKLVRSDIALGRSNGDPRSSFRKDVGPLYFQLADLLLRRAEDPTRSADQHREDLLEARDIVERLKSGELEDYFQDECVNEVKLKQQQIAALDEHTAVVYVIPLEDRIELLVDLPVSNASAKPGAGLRAVRVDGVGRSRLDDVVNGFRNGLEHRATDDYLDDGKQLYEWLVRPIKPLLDAHQIQTLVSVPDGALRTVPMAALYDAKAGQFLVEQYATAVTPGLTLMEPRALSRQNVRLLLNGLSEAREGFPSLPYVPGELKSISNSFPSESKELLNSQFVVGAFRSEIREEPYTIVHIASHGEFKGEAKSTFILAYDQRLTLNELQTLIHPTELRGQPVELLTLSACRTAEGDDRAALGLAGVAIKAGARSALASLWSLNDASSSMLIADFYHQLSADPGISKATALQRAQLQLLNDPRLNLSHPIFWAPFIVIGNWL